MKIQEIKTLGGGRASVRGYLRGPFFVARSRSAESWNVIHRATGTVITRATRRAEAFRIISWIGDRLGPVRLDSLAGCTRARAVVRILLPVRNTLAATRVRQKLCVVDEVSYARHLFYEFSKDRNMIVTLRKVRT